MSHRSRHRTPLTLLLLSALALAACGGGGSSSSSTEEATTTTEGVDACELVASSGDPAASLTEAAEVADGEVASAVEALRGALAAEDRAEAESAASDLAAACGDPALEGAAGDWQLAAAEVAPTYTCAGADPSSSSLLQVFGADVTFNPSLALDAVQPAPAEGEAFEVSFTGALELAGDLVDGVIAVGITSATVNEMMVTIAGLEGVEGEPVVGNPPPTEFELVAGEPVALTVGPYTGTFTRTSAVGSPVSFAPGALDLTLSATFNGAAVDLALTCEPEAGATLTTTDGRA
jgi:hypothetical protein